MEASHALSTWTTIIYATPFLLLFPSTLPLQQYYIYLNIFLSSFLELEPIIAVFSVCSVCIRCFIWSLCVYPSLTSHWRSLENVCQQTTDPRAKIISYCYGAVMLWIGKYFFTINTNLSSLRFQIDGRQIRCKSVSCFRWLGFCRFTVSI